MEKLSAAFIFFTRLPFWRVLHPGAAAYSRVVDCWTTVGWFTGAITALTLLLASMALPWTAAVICALTMRVLITGALHEDGLADFFDGLGGGRTREDVLRIMKDSHIGTYGVLGLILYYMFAVSLLGSLPPEPAVMLVFASDPFGKLCASQLINLLPYARTAETAKNRTVYARMSPLAFIFSLLMGVLPMFLFPARLMLGALLAPAVAAMLILLLRRRIGGYTGDCCGAFFLLSELACWAGIAIMMRL